MFLARTVAILALLGTTVAEETYVPIHKRFSYDVSINDFSYLGMLSKRDSCSDAFGPSAHNSNCAPDITLCCTRDGQEYPSCEKWLKKGWCCVGGGDNDKCYVDQASVCDEDSSVACTNLANGTTKACCPKLTTCDKSLEASENLVRCNINRGDLLVANAAASGKTSTTAASSSTLASSTTLSPATVTAPVAETTSAAPSDNSTTISGGAIGGIVVGAVAGVAGVAGLLFWLFRCNKKARNEAANQTPPQPSIQQYYYEQQMKYGQQPQGYYPGSDQNSAFAYSGSHPNQQLPSPPPAELMDQRHPVELNSTARS